MFCTTCRMYPDIADKSCSLYVGLTSFRIGSLQAHEKSSQHLICTQKKLKSKMTVQDKADAVAKSPLMQAAKKAKTINMNILTVMFNTVFTLAKKGKPLSDYEIHMDLHMKNRKDVGSDYIDIGSNYHTEKSAKNFLMSIAEQLRQNTVEETTAARFLTVLADGSTDSSIVEQYVVLVRFVNADGVPVTKLASIQAVDSADSQGIVTGILNGLERLDLRQAIGGKPTVIGVNFDGAAVMMGCKTGVSATLKKDLPHLISVHCVAHKLELGVLDAVKCITYLQKFEKTIKLLYKFYQRSPRRRRHLQEIASMLDSDILRYGDVKTVRWVASKSKALKAVQNNFEATIAHLEHAAADNRSDEGSKAKYLLSEMRSVRFLKYLNVMLDYLTAITKTSENFQRNQLLIIEVDEIIDDLKSLLEVMKEEPGQNTSRFYSCLDKTTLQYSDSHPVPIQLTGKAPDKYQTDCDAQTLLEKSVQYLETRFRDFKEKPLSNFSVFHFRYWPRDDRELLKFGRTEIRELLDHFSPLLNDDEKSQTLSEWTLLKNRVKRQRTSKLFTVYSELLAACPEEIQNILTLVQIMVTLSPSTAECERQFSAMNNIKTALRTCLNQDTLEALLRVRADGPQITEYDASPAIELWLSSGPGTKHLNGHQKTTKPTYEEDPIDDTPRNLD